MSTREKLIKEWLPIGGSGALVGWFGNLLGYNHEMIQWWAILGCFILGLAIGSITAERR